MCTSLRFFLLVSLSTFLFCEPVLAQKTLYVDVHNLNCPGSGTRANPYCTIGLGIAAAQKGDTVHVLPGTYVENIDFAGKAITVKSRNGPSVTTIDGNQKGSVVVFRNGERLDSVLDGFTITNGIGTPHGGFYSGGGGIFANYTSPTIINNIITRNYTDGSGAGLGFFNTGKSVIKDNVIKENWGCLNGGGILIDGEALLEGNIIKDNLSISVGGGIWCRGNATIRNNIITGNQVRLINPRYFPSGGGICIGDVQPASPKIINNVIHGNSASGRGGGIYCGWDYSATVVNTILWGNKAPSGKEIYIAKSSNPVWLTISHSDVEGGKASVHVEAGSKLNWGAGMITARPLFADPLHNDYHLLYPSPCRNTGDNSAPGLPKHDFEGDPRVASGKVDMGADEFSPHLYHTGNPEPGGLIIVKVAGLPRTSPVILFLGLYTINPPLSTPFGLWHLGLPVFPILLSTIPQEGIELYPRFLPANAPGPYSIAMQALVGNQLTNLSMLAVK